MARIIKKGDVTLACLAQMLPEPPDDRGPGCFRVPEHRQLQRDPLRPVDALPQVFGKGLDVIDATAQGSDWSRILVDPDQKRVECARHGWFFP
jgi:hypothetical protein